MPRKLLITLFTDAGYCPDTKVGSWAAWAKAGGETMRRAGPLKASPKSSTAAELMAVANGLHAAIRHFAPNKGSLILVQTDSMAAIDIMLGRSRKPRTIRRHARYKDAILAMLLPNQLDIEFRHVPGHAGPTTPRTAVNTWCDAQCTFHLKRARVEFRRHLITELDKLRTEQEEAINAG